VPRLLYTWRLSHMWHDSCTHVRWPISTLNFEMHVSSAYIHICICIHICMYTYMSVSRCTCRVHIFTYVYIYMYICDMTHVPMWDDAFGDVNVFYIYIFAYFYILSNASSDMSTWVTSHICMYIYIYILIYVLYMYREHRGDVHIVLYTQFPLIFLYIYFLQFFFKYVPRASWRRIFVSKSGAVAERFMHWAGLGNYSVTMNKWINWYVDTWRMNDEWTMNGHVHEEWMDWYMNNKWIMWDSSSTLPL